MKRSLVIVSVFALALGCGDSTGESATAREPEEVIVDAFNMALAGGFIAYEEERRQPNADAIAAHDADILCLQEVWTQEDKELIRFPYTGQYGDGTIGAPGCQAEQELQPEKLIA